MQIGERRERRRWRKIKLAAHLQHMKATKALRVDGKNLMPEDERAEKYASGRVFTGNDCEYIKISCVIANDGCLDGE